jgi:hypothetical protein
MADDLSTAPSVAAPSAAAASRDGGGRPTARGKRPVRPRPSAATARAPAEPAADAPDERRLDLLV